MCLEKIATAGNRTRVETLGGFHHATRPRLLLLLLLWVSERRASLAQSVERKALNLVVVGSSPTGGESFSPCRKNRRLGGSNSRPLVYRTNALPLS